MTHELNLAEYACERDRLPTPPGIYPFITISRQAGAGGHALAKALLKRLRARTADPWAADWQIYDYQLCQQIAKDPALHVSLEALLSEEYRKESQIFFQELRVGRCDQYQLNKRILNLVRALAQRGKAIIVGRAGNFATSELASGIHVRLVAPEARRLKVMMKLLSLPEPKARAEMEAQDEARARLVNDFFCRDIQDPLAYHLVVNTALISFEDAAALIEPLVAKKAREIQPT